MIIMLIMALATWRLSSLFMFDDAPLNFAKRIRIKLGVEEESESVGFWDGLYSCMGCFSTWTGIFVTILSIPYLFTTYHWTVAVPTVILLPFALSASAILLDKLESTE